MCKNVPDPTTLRKYQLPVLYNMSVEKLRDYIGDSDIYVQIDESSDLKMRPMVSMLLGPLT